MAQPYKLNSTIEQFILSQKRQNPKFSCRKLVSLIKEEFKVEISKSSINTIIKANSLSNRSGRPGIRQKPALPPLPVETSPLPGQEVPPPVIIKEPAVQEKLADNQASPREEPVFEATNFVSASPEFPQAEEIVPYAATPKTQSLEIRIIEETSVDIENGGAIFLLMIDYKSGLTDFLAQIFLSYMPDLSQDIVRLLIQSRVYSQIIKEEERLGKFLGKELTGEYLAFYYEQIAKIPLDHLNSDFTSLGLKRNINEINMLYKECLLCLNRQVQKIFLPAVYQFLDFAAMCERFYSLMARVDRKDTMITVQFLYPGSFKAIQDIVWQEDFKFAVSALNKERIFTPEGKLFRFEEMLAAYH